MQPNGPEEMVAATAAHSMIWERDANNNAAIVYTDGRHLKQVTSGKVASTITENEFAATPGNQRWPVDRFDGHAFFGSHHDGLHWYDGNNSGKCGIAAPANAATPSAGGGEGLVGVYKLKYTFVNSKGHESAPSPASNAHVSNDNPIIWSNIETGPSGTSKRKLYRTVNDGGTFHLLTTLNDNVTTTYNDSVLDAGLGLQVEEDNSDLPPTTIRGMAVEGSRMYLLDGNSYLWACKIDSNNSLPNWEAYPTVLSTKIPAGEGSDVVQNIFVLGEYIFTATRKRTFRVEGDPYTGQRTIKVAEVGLFNRWSWCYLEENDRKYVVMLTSNFKVIKMDEDGNYTELARDILSALQSITNKKAPDLDDSVELSHDSRLGLIIIHCATTGTENHTSLCLDLATGEWSGPVDWGYMFSTMSDDDQTYVGYEKGSRIVRHNNSLYQKDAALGTYFNNQTFETYPFFLRDKSIEVARIGIVCRARPWVGYIPPMLQVSWAFDNNDDLWKSEYVDISDIGRRIGTTGNAQVAQEQITVYVPLHRTMHSISVKVTAPENAASLQGLEIYDIFIEVAEVEEVHPKGRDIDRDRR
jgi:hypothetical protein